MPSDVWEATAPGDHKLVALALLDYGPVAWPSQRTLAAKCGMKLRTLHRVIRAMQHPDAVIQLQTKGSGKALKYVVHLRQIGVAPTPRWRSTYAKLAQGSELSQELSHQPAPQAAPVGVSSLDREAVYRTDPRARDDWEAQERGTRRRMAEQGIDGADADAVWVVLVRRWAKTGTRPYDTLTAIMEQSMAGVRDRRKVLLHRLTEAA